MGAVYLQHFHSFKLFICTILDFGIILDNWNIFNGLLPTSHAQERA